MRSPGFSSHRLIFYIRIWSWVCMIIVVEALQDLLPYIFFCFSLPKHKCFKWGQEDAGQGSQNRTWFTELCRSTNLNQFCPAMPCWEAITHLLRIKALPKIVILLTLCMALQLSQGSLNALLGSKIGCEFKTSVELRPWKWGEVIAGVKYGADSVTVWV